MSLAGCCPGSSKLVDTPENDEKKNTLNRTQGNSLWKFDVAEYHPGINCKPS